MQYNVYAIVRIAFFCNLDIRSMVVPQTNEAEIDVRNKEGIIYR